MSEKERFHELPSFFAPWAPSGQVGGCRNLPGIALPSRRKSDLEVVVRACWEESDIKSYPKTERTTQFGIIISNSMLAMCSWNRRHVCYTCVKKRHLSSVMWPPSTIPVPPEPIDFPPPARDWGHKKCYKSQQKLHSPSINKWATILQSRELCHVLNLLQPRTVWHFSDSFYYYYVQSKQLSEFHIKCHCQIWWL